MKAFLILGLSIFGMFLSLAIGQGSPSQGPIELVKLYPPTYPPLARQARIEGDVKIEVSVRQDGSVDSAEVVSGHPMLKQAALDSVQQSQYACRSCSKDATPLMLMYTFGFYRDAGCREITTRKTVRSSRCLFLWKCGVRETHDWAAVYRKPQVTQTLNHVTILVSTDCVQTENSYESGRNSCDR